VKVVCLVGGRHVPPSWQTNVVHLLALAHKAHKRMKIFVRRALDLATAEADAAAAEAHAAADASSSSAAGGASSGAVACAADAPVLAALALALARCNEPGVGGAKAAALDALLGWQGRFPAATFAGKPAPESPRCGGSSGGRGGGSGGGGAGSSGGSGGGSSYPKLKLKLKRPASDLADPRVPPSHQQASPFALPPPAKRARVAEGSAPKKLTAASSSSSSSSGSAPLRTMTIPKKPKPGSGASLGGSSNRASGPAPLVDAPSWGSGGSDDDDADFAP
jgi:hypothetical protein